MKQAYIYGLVDPRDAQIHYVGHTIDMLGRYAGHLADESDTPKTRWIAEAVAESAPPSMIVLAKVPYDERHSHEYKWIYLGRAMGWPLTNTMAMKTEAYTQLMEGLGGMLVVEVDRGLTWRKLNRLTYPLGVLAMGIGALSQMYYDVTGRGAFVAIVAVLLAVGLSWVSRNTEVAA